MRLVCALSAFFLAFFTARGLGSLSGSSLFATLGAALHATITLGLATIGMLLIADLATVAEFPKYRQLVLFTAYFIGLLAVTTLIFAMCFGVGYKSPDKGLHQYAFAMLAAWAAYSTTLWVQPSR